MKSINIVGEGGEEGCRSCAGGHRRLALQLHPGTIDLQHDEGQLPDLKAHRLGVFELHVQTEQLVVKELGLLQVLDKQDDGSYVLNGGVHWLIPPSSVLTDS